MSEKVPGPGGAHSYGTEPVSLEEATRRQLAANAEHLARDPYAQAREAKLQADLAKIREKARKKRERG